MLDAHTHTHRRTYCSVPDCSCRRFRFSPRRLRDVAGAWAWSLLGRVFNGRSLRWSEDDPEQVADVYHKTVTV